jgi:hypothetical protein
MHLGVLVDTLATQKHNLLKVFIILFNGLMAYELFDIWVALLRIFPECFTRR